MASKFYIVCHHFKPGQAKAWWPIAQAHLSDKNKYDAWVSASLEKGFYNHSFNPVATEGPIFCIWETREVITSEQFQEFIDGSGGPNFGLNAFHNICHQIDLSLSGNPPYPAKFN